MALLKKELFNYATEVTEALTDAYTAKHGLSTRGALLSGLMNLATGVADIAINGYKASSPLLGLYQLYKASLRPQQTMAPKPHPDEPRLRADLPRPRPPGY